MNRDIRSYRPQIRAVDAVMGTGKSTWAIEEIKRTDKPYIVVLPYNDEITRYANQLKDHVDLVALDDSSGNSGATSKTQAFIDALEYSDCIIITHKLFVDHITRDTLRLISEGNWNLIIDEALGTFEEQKGLDWQHIEAFERDGIASVQPLTDTISTLVLHESQYDNYMANPKRIPFRKAVIRNLLHRDFLMMATVEGKDDFYMYTLSGRLLDAFKSVTLLTYLFKGSEMDLWCQFKGYKVEHLELRRDGAGHTLQPHSGVYSGSRFKDLIEVVVPQGRGKRYGDDKYDFSNNRMKRLTKDSSELKQIQQGLRNFLLKYKFDTKADFLFTCKKDIIEDKLLPCRAHKLYETYVGQDNWLAYNARGTNAYADRHFIFYGTNVFQFPRVILTLKGLGLEYDEGQFALSMLVQFLWRSAIRRGEKITVAVPSMRMRDILESWLGS